MWSKNYDSCIECGTTDRKHTARGLCGACYRKQPHIKEKKRQWYLENVRGTDRQRLRRERIYHGGNRRAVLERDGHRCTECGARKQLVVHHLDKTGRDDKNRDHSADMLVTLCRACHVQVHRTLARWARGYDCCRDCGRTDRKHNAKGLCWHCYLLRANPPKLKGTGRWALYHEKCLNCGTTEVRHKGHGLCLGCYSDKAVRSRFARPDR